ncbi:MAG: hypothetical protein JWO06_74, partial [Bacteroidota bacterium]|nr:hypothetical protein [Bacteroidota bacterium]
ATSSSTGISASGYQNSYGGGGNSFNAGDAFLVKFDSSGNRLWSTYYGGTGNEWGLSVSTDPLGNSFLAGFTTSATNISSAGSFLNNLVGQQASFLVKFNSLGQRTWATYYGGSSNDIGFAITCDAGNNIYLCGQTLSAVYIAYHGHQDTIGGSTGGDAYLVKFDSSGNRLWATYLGGKNADYGQGLSVDKYLNVYMSGITLSPDSIFNNGFQNSYGGGAGPIGGDAFLVKYNSAGQLVWGSYFGGNNHEIFAGVTADNFDNVYLAGSTNSTSGVSLNGFMDTISGQFLYAGFHDYDGFLAKIGVCNISAFDLTNDKVLMCSNDSAHLCAPAGYQHYLWNNGAITQCIFASSAGNYYATVSNDSNCQVSSNHLSLQVYPTPPVSISVNGDTLTVYNSVACQWFLDGQPIAGATQPVYIANSTGSYTVAVTNSNGCSAISSPYIISGIGVLPEEKMDIYPNPLALGAWNLRVNKNLVGADINVFNMAGDLVFQSKIAGSLQEVNFPCAPGVYLLRVSSSDNYLIRKLIKL